MDSSQYQPVEQSIQRAIGRIDRAILVAFAAANDDFAEQLFIGVSTVKKHVNHIFDKLSVESRTQAIVRANTLKIL